MSTSILDHVVVNVGFEMDTAELCFAQAGFALTPRGRHSLGSINHLAMFGSDYLELIGLPAGEPVRRREIADEGTGFKGLVFKSADVDATFAHLQSLGIDGEPPRSFSRPVVVDGVEREARFRTVAVRPGAFSAGRVYFCEHLTPQWVWHAAWQQHDNGVNSIVDCTVVAAQPAHEARRYASLLGIEPANDMDSSVSIDLGGPRLRFVTASEFVRRFGINMPLSEQQPTAFAALSLASTNLHGARTTLARSLDWSVLQAQPDRLVVHAAAFGALLEFVHIAPAG